MLLRRCGARSNRCTVRAGLHRLRDVSDETDVQVNHAFQLVTGREPTPSELAALKEYAARFGHNNLGRLLFNLNEFVFID